MKQLVKGSSPLLLFILLSIFHLSSTAFSLVCLDLILASPRSPCSLPTTRDVPSSNEPDRAGQPGIDPRNQMSPKGGKKAQKTAWTVRTSPVVDPQHLPTEPDVQSICPSSQKIGRPSPSTLAFLNTLLKREEQRNLLLPRKNNSSTLILAAA